ncbi:helix-hairpin-helix domain-containing protein [Streptomyces sp. NPDC001822]|uniref:helix-hairpin-helix domain-containing protein n=1 Tax=Streptomyces sp. NPDC001822 TaxID=3364614 RepID=UPI003688AEE7
MSYRSLPTPGLPAVPQQPSGAARIAPDRIGQVHAHPSRHADTNTHRGDRRPVRGTGPTGRARHRSGVRPGGAAGTSPGAAHRVRHGRRRLARGFDAEAAAASRLRADALMAGGRSLPTEAEAAGRSLRSEAEAGGCSVQTEAAAGVSAATGRARAAPSWAVRPDESAVSTRLLRPADRGADPAPEPGRQAAPAVAGPLRPPDRGVPRTSGARAWWWREAGSALRDRLPLWIQLRCGLEPRALAAVGVILAGAVILAAAHFRSARPETVRAPERVAEAAAVQAGTPGPPGAGDPSPLAAGSSVGPTPGGRIVVDVSGKVRRPGIQYLPAGSRVADALRAAGGVREGADVTGLNRARVLTDGEQVAVGLPAAQPPPGAGTGPGSGRTGPVAPLSLGSATAEQLETLPGVGPVLAQHIIDYRTEHGGYRSVDELREVNGIGDRRFADLRTLVTP